MADSVAVVVALCCDVADGIDAAMMPGGEEVTALNLEYERTYSVSEIARMLGRPRTTINGWIELFREFLPTVGRGRTLRYKESAIEILSIIAEMKDSGEPNEYIRQYLQSLKKEVVIDAEDSNQHRVPYLANLVELLQRLDGEIRSIRERLDELEEQVRSSDGRQRDVIEQLRAENQKLREELAAAKAEIATAQAETYRSLHEGLNKVQQTLSRIEKRREQERNRSWWRRLFGSGDEKT